MGNVGGDASHERPCRSGIMWLLAECSINPLEMDGCLDGWVDV